MIREYATFFKHFSEKRFKTDIEIFNETIENIDVFHLKCPHCKANGRCGSFASYGRMMVSFEERAVITHYVSIPRVKCGSCKLTHAILPSVLIPHSIYSLIFILTVLQTFYRKDLTIQQICELYEISHSTIYLWVGLLKEHKVLWLGVLKDLEVSGADFICELFNMERLEQKLNTFFISNGYSFLQNTTVYDSA